MKLTQLARKTLECYFENKKFIPDEKTQKQYSEKRACFVTLTKNNNLRGCIGTLKACQELWKDIQQNAIHAALHDTRFHPLTENELKDIKIEVSVLSNPKPLNFSNLKDLLNKINNKMGIILKKGFYSSTFLPQVWEQLPNKIEFLEHLSFKAGLSRDAWKTSEISYYTINAEKEE